MVAWSPLRWIDPGRMAAVAGFVFAYVGLAEAAAAVSRSAGLSVVSGFEAIALVSGGFALVGLLPIPRALTGAPFRVADGVWGAAALALLALPFAPAIDTAAATLAGWSLWWSLALFVLCSVALAVILMAGLAVSRLVSGWLFVSVGLLLFFHRDWWLSLVIQHAIR